MKFSLAARATQTTGNSFLDGLPRYALTRGEGVESFSIKICQHLQNPGFVTNYLDWFKCFSYPRPSLLFQGFMGQVKNLLSIHNPCLRFTVNVAREDTDTTSVSPILNEYLQIIL